MNASVKLRVCRERVERMDRLSEEMSAVCSDPHSDLSESLFILDKMLKAVVEASP